MSAYVDRVRSRARDNPNVWLVPAVILLGLLYPFLEDPLSTLPLIGDFMPTTGTVVVMIAFTMMAVGLNIVVGYCGLLDLGYVAFYAVGAYTAGWFASQHFEQVTFHFGSSVNNDLVGIHLTMWLVLIIAGLLTMFAGIVIGLPTLRLRGDYLAIVTLGFGEIIPQVVRNGDSFGGFNLTGGTFGIAPIDPVGFPVLSAIGLPENFQTSDNRERWYYLIAFLLLLFTVFCSVRLRDSRLGRAWIAIREDETAAAAMGVPLMKTKTWAYALGAFFGGIAGRLLRELQVRRVPRGLLLQHLGVPALHGHPGRDGEHLGSGRRWDDPARTSTSAASRRSAARSRTPGSTSTRRSTSSGSTGSSSS